MSLTKKQKDIVDALHNGGFIWAKASVYYLSRTYKNSYNSEVINVRTFKALEPLLKEHSNTARGGTRWHLK